MLSMTEGKNEEVVTPLDRGNVTICAKCRDLLYPPKGRTWDDLRASADEGCFDCAIMQRLAHQVIPPEVRQYVQTIQWFGLSRHGPGPDREIRVEFRSVTGLNILPALQLFTPPGQLSPWPHLPVSCGLHGDTGCEASLQRAQSWLYDCLSTHGKCGSAHGEQSPLPMRLVDVQPAESSDVRILETNVGQTGLYCCVSHCWGNPVATSGDPTARQGCPLSELPKTFRDAIDFVRRLGVRFLWIDSLCIIQDDEQDWKRHASQMAAIYQNSYLTLAATWAPDGSFGLYCRTGRLMALAPYAVHYRESNSHCEFDEYEDKRDGPLLQRAWVFQERLLSPRILHFSGSELVWECNSKTTCECGEWPFKDENTLKPRWATIFQAGVRGEMGELWHHLIGHYCQLDITKRSDRLPALLGIARRFREDPASRLIAGCWEDWLPTELLWQRDLSQRPVLRDMTTADLPYPTWSWMSMESAVVYPDVLGGEITPRATVKNLSIDPARSIDRRAFSWADITLSGHTGTARFAGDQVLDVYFGNEAPRGMDFVIDYSIPACERENQQVFCIWMATSVDSYENEGHVVELSDFVVGVRCVDEAEQVYERIGLVWARSEYEAGCAPSETPLAAAIRREWPVRTITLR